MITVTPVTSTSQSYTLVEPGTTELVTISFTVQEDDTSLPVGNVSATVDWSNGTAIESFGPSPDSLSVTTSRALTTGKYLVKVRATNYRQPTPNVVIQYFVIIVANPKSSVVAQGYLSGPILPKDVGSPSILNWNFNLGKDTEVLASSVKMLLLTQKGERVMNPEFGTSLRSIVFDLATDETNALVENEITRALAQFEPRVEMVDYAVRRENRNVYINMVLTSKLTQSTFDLVLPFQNQ